jgi:hypothetical protein
MPPGSVQLGARFQNAGLQEFLLASKQIDDVYKKRGGESGRFGFGRPVTDVELVSGGGWRRVYQNGAIFWPPALRRPIEVWSPIWDKYRSLGAERSVLGYPIADQADCVDGHGHYSNFERGMIYWHPGHPGPFEVHGQIGAKWLEWGAEGGLLGYPLSDEMMLADQRGRHSEFEHGSIYWTPEYGAHEINGAIRDEWVRRHAWQGTLGYPITDGGPMYGSDGVSQSFEHGWLVWHPHSPLKSHVESNRTARWDSGPLPGDEIEGWVKLAVNAEGYWRLRGHVHGGGSGGFNYTVAAALSFDDPQLHPVGFSHSGIVHGTFDIGSRDDDFADNGWDEFIMDNFDVISTDAKFHSGLSRTLNGWLLLEGAAIGFLTVIGMGVGLWLGANNSVQCEDRDDGDLQCSVHGDSRAHPDE